MSKNKTKVRKANKTKRTRRFRKYYGGGLIEPQKKYITGLGFSIEEENEIINDLNNFSSFLSSKKHPRTNNSINVETVLNNFFENVNPPTQEGNPEITIEKKKKIF